MWEFTSSPCVCVGFLQILRFPICCLRWIVYSELVLSVNDLCECVCVCLVPRDGLASHPECIPVSGFWIHYDPDQNKVLNEDE